MRARNRKTKAVIIGTSETIAGTALTLDDSFERNPDGSLEYDHDGETTVSWDSQTTNTRDGKTLFVDRDGDELTEDDLELFEACDECDGEGQLRIGRTSRYVPCEECGGSGDAMVESQTSAVSRTPAGTQR